MKHFLAVLPAVLAAALLAGCPQSKLPDMPPNVPQPKASGLQQSSGIQGIQGMLTASALT